MVAQTTAGCFDQEDKIKLIGCIYPHFLEKKKCSLPAAGSVTRFLFVCLHQVSEVAQSCPTLCDPMDCSLPGSFVHGIFQARILEWVAISFSMFTSRGFLKQTTRKNCSHH
ncbi:unnamed protein product [Rangifer tarandus platyrhynchus]|uniref:Uncharacterized protein n=2 Tax=Rangifer tarandus platyrhynchus TaxID=3082113 RepID=A0AC59YJV2_RANTA|nr:unnamed protein product [Rangifer tarandus platyrhynchus]